MPPGHTAVRRLSNREKWMVGGVLGVVAVLAVALVISLSSSAPSSSNGCIYATIPGSVGAQQVHECGDTARATCQTVHTPGAFTAQAAATLVGRVPQGRAAGRIRLIGLASLGVLRTTSRPAQRRGMDAERAAAATPVRPASLPGGRNPTWRGPGPATDAGRTAPRMPPQAAPNPPQISRKPR